MNLLLNSGDTGNKRQIFNVYAGFDHATQWEQKGNRLGTKWEQFYMMKFINYSFLLPATQTITPLIPLRLPTHLAGIERGRYPLGTYPCTLRAVDNFMQMPNLSIAYFLGSVHNICKCLNLLNIPNNVQKVTHNPHFIRRALC